MWEEANETIEDEVRPTILSVKDQSDSYRKALQIVRRPPSDEYFVGKDAVMLLEGIVTKFGSGKPVAFKKIKEFAFQEFGFKRWHVSKLCDKLWKRGLLRKWAQGIWREGQIARSAGMVGRFYGVHYEVLE